MKKIAVLQHVERFFNNVLLQLTAAKVNYLLSALFLCCAQIFFPNLLFLQDNLLSLVITETESTRMSVPVLTFLE